MTGTVKTPIWFWIVALLILLWNSFGGYDYTMTQTGDAAYLAPFTAAQRAYFENYPWYADGLWALGVWGAVAGSLLLFLRSRHAVTAFALSLAGLAASNVWQFIIARDATAAAFPDGVGMVPFIVWPAAIACLCFAWWSRRRALLR